MSKLRFSISEFYTKNFKIWIRSYFWIKNHPDPGQDFRSAPRLNYLDTIAFYCLNLQGHQDPVLGAEFVPSSNKKFVTYGKGHVIFWDLEGNKLVKKSGIFEVRED